MKSTKQLINMTKEEKILVLASEIGFDNAAVISTEEFCFVPEYRKYCEDNLCVTCKMPEGIPCPQGEEQFSCLSAYCIDAGKLAETCGMEIKTWSVICCLDESIGPLHLRIRKIFKV